MSFSRVGSFVLGAAVTTAGVTGLQPVRDANATRLLSGIEKRLDESGAAQHLVGMGKVSTRDIFNAILKARQYPPITNDELIALENLAKKAEGIVPAQAKALYTGVQELKK